MGVSPFGDIVEFEIPKFLQLHEICKNAPDITEHDTRLRTIWGYRVILLKTKKDKFTVTNKYLRVDIFSN